MEISYLDVGVELGPTDWLEVDQLRINRFADATDDHQWIHVDSARASRGPYGVTIAHGWLTLALMAPFTAELLDFAGLTAVNYGLDKLRFPAPVLVGSRLRARMTVSSVTPIEGSCVQLAVHASVEREGESKPACVADLLYRLYPRDQQSS
jgi:acyl dehydratase